ncbi:MAG: 30S ribosomal protein S8 [archaeon]
MVVRNWISAMMNDIMNCKRSGLIETEITPVSKLIVSILEILKKEEYIKNFEIMDEKFKKLKVTLGLINECKAINPRFFVKKDGYDKYIKRFLPSRNLGILIVSTNKGLMTHKEAIENGYGGSLIAYCF